MTHLFDGEYEDSQSHQSIIKLKINLLSQTIHLYFLSDIPLDYISVVLFLVSFEVYALRR
jgi:hypothetical protein